MAWQKNGTPSTLTGTADVITISDMEAKKFNVLLSHQLDSSNTSHSLRFNNNSNSVYAHRASNNGGSDGTQVSQTIIDEPLLYASDKFAIYYFCSISGEEKLGMWFECAGNTAGAGTAPVRQEMVYKFVPSPDADITRVDLINDQAGDFAIGSNLSALGTD